jgi:hypothetical protein
MVETREALSIDELLRRIPQYEVNNGCALFKRHYMKVPLVIGAIGIKGSGKSGTISVISLLDDLLEGKPVRSNLEIKAEYDISDAIAQQYGLPHGGSVEFHSEPVDKKRLLRFTPEYQGCALVLDEINVEYAESRRSPSNVNLWFNDLDQQLRKLQMPLYYSVIHEMWIDPRLRDMTDIFIKCDDPAISPQGIINQVPEGLQTKWTIYDMTGKLTGVSYLEARKPLPPRYLQLRQWWGIWDTAKRQAKEAGQYTFKMQETDQVTSGVSVKPSKVVEQEQNEWGWLDESLTEIMQEMREDGRKEISRPELFARLGITPSERLRVGTELKYRLKTRYSSGNSFYQIPQADLSVPESMRSEQLKRERSAIGAT